jgi:uncharacterized caspase-like protein
MATYDKLVMLSVGIGDYINPSVNDLSLPPSDARAMAEAVKALGHPNTQVELLLNREATKANIQAGLDRLASSVGPDDLAVFFYSGHGARYRLRGTQEEDQYDEFLCPADSGVKGGVETLIRDDEFYEWMGKVRAQTQHVAVLVDACHSGGINRVNEEDELQPKEIAQTVMAAILRDYQRPARRVGLISEQVPGQVLLAASLPHQVSYELRSMRNGLFTTYLLEGLAKPDIATFQALFNYARPLTEQRIQAAGRTQTPRMVDGTGGALPYR